MATVNVNVGEAGKRNGSADQNRVQQMHDTAVELGADCGEPDADDTKGAKESAAPWIKGQIRAFKEAGALKQGDSVNSKLNKISKAVGSHYQDSPGYAYTKDVFPNHVVVQHGNKMYAHSYDENESGGVSLGDPVEVESTYSPIKPSDFLEASALGAVRLFDMPFSYIERDIPKSTRDNADASDFAGKGRSFPILKAEDVKAALSSIGRAGSGNYSAAELKSRILAIAKRKGFAIPKSDQAEADGAGLAPGTIRLEESAVDLVEKAVRADGTIPIKIIQPGWGSSGYYPAEVLERDGPKIFTKGLHMYLDHPTPTEESERPERSVKDLAATLTGTARYLENGPAGKGLYADALVTSPYRQFIEEVADKIGVSIRAAGTAESGKAEGKEGPIIKSLAAAESIDFVTKAGAGGKILQLFEAARSRQPIEGATNMAQVTLEESEAKQLREAAAENARLREAINIRDAKDFAIEQLHEVDLPKATAKRLIETLSKDAPTKDGKLDRDAFKKKIAEAVTAEVAYLAEAAGYGDGKVRGMGTSGAGTGTAAPKAEDTEKQLTESFKRLGMSDKEAQIAAKGRR